MPLIGLSGYARAGKDSVAEVLVERHGFRRRAFADELRDVLYTLDPQVDGFTVRELVDGIGWEGAKAHAEVRRLLQVMGTEVGRARWGEDFWVDRMFAGTRVLPWVITDVRFPNEALAVQDRGGVVWRVERPECGPVNGHVSETALDGYPFDNFVFNHGTLDDLASEVERLLKEEL